MFNAYLMHYKEAADTVVPQNIPLEQRYTTGPVVEGPAADAYRDRLSRIPYNRRVIPLGALMGKYLQDQVNRVEARAAQRGAAQQQAQPRGLNRFWSGMGNMIGRSSVAGAREGYIDKLRSAAGRPSVEMENRIGKSPYLLNTNTGKMTRRTPNWLRKRFPKWNKMS